MCIICPQLGAPPPTHVLPLMCHSFLNKAARGDVAFIGEQLSSNPELLKSVSVLRKQNALHLAAQEGHM
jgi:hypothetical protein